MGRTTSFTLGEHFEKFVSKQVEAGGYQTASEVIRAGLRLLERESTLAALRAAYLEGKESGIAEDFSWDKVKEAALKRVQDGGDGVSSI